MKRKRTKHLKALLFCLTLLSVVLSACQSDLYEFEKTEPTLPPEIAAAKAWYETEIGGSSLYWRVGERSGMLEADWHNAFAGDDAYFRIIEIPLGGDQQFYRMSPEVFERIKSTGDKRYLASVMRLLIRICEETNEKDAFVMEVSPDLEYLSKNLDNSLQNFTYLSHGEEFSGLVLFYNLAGTLVDGYLVTGGEFFRVISPNQPQLRGSCTMFIDAIHWYVNGNYQHTQIVNVEVVCTPGGGGGVSPGPGGTGGGTGSGSGNQPPPTLLPSPAITADMIFRDPDTRIQQQLDEIWDDCMGRALLNAIASNLGSNRLNLEFRPGNISHYDRSTGTIMIGTGASGAPVVLHELFHAYQSQNYSSMAVYAGNQLNHEIEAQLAQYMFTRRMPREYIGFWNTHFNSHPKYYSITELARRMDNQGNITNATRFNAELRNIAIPLFQESRLYRDLRFNPNMSTNDMFANLRRLSAGCP